MEYKKRLCDLVNLEENSHDTVVLTVKPETTPLDLIRLGGFEGNERILRMSKDPRTTCISVFDKDGEVFHMNFGASTALVNESRLKVRRLVMECVNLDFGIFTHRPVVEDRFDSLVEETSGPRDLDSPRHFTLTRNPSYSSLSVNGQHIDNIDNDRLESWLADRNAQLKVLGSRPGYLEVDYGNVHRICSPELEHQATSRSEQQRFERTIDKAAQVFSGKTGWRGLNAANAVREFVRFAKQDGPFLESDLGDAVREAKERAARRNSEQERGRSNRKPPELER